MYGLFDEQPILADKALAREIGLTGAIILQQINYWMEINRKAGKNFFDGKYWTYNSLRAWQENDFDYLSLDTVKRTFSKLEKEGFLLVGHFNKDPRDKTKWYSLNESRLNQLCRDIEERKRKEAEVALKKSDETPLPNALVQNAPMERCKMPQCTGADCPDAWGQNALMRGCKMPQALPEITTETTTEISTEISTDPSSHPPFLSGGSHFHRGRTDGRVEGTPYQYFLEELRQQVGYYAHLEVGNLPGADAFDEILKVLADVLVLNPNEILTINQTKMPAAMAQERFRALNYSHLEFLVHALKENEHRIRNIRAFILTAAYNAPSSMEAYYTALVNYDLRGGLSQ